MGLYPERRPRLAKRDGDAEQIVSYAVYAGRRGFEHVSEEIPNEIAVAAANMGTAAIMGLFSEDDYYD